MDDVVRDVTQSRAIVGCQTNRGCFFFLFCESRRESCDVITKVLTLLNIADRSPLQTNLQKYFSAIRADFTGACFADTTLHRDFPRLASQVNENDSCRPTTLTRYSLPITLR